MKTYLYLRPESKDYLKDRFGIDDLDFVSSGDRTFSSFPFSHKLSEAVETLVIEYQKSDELESDLKYVLIDLFQMRYYRTIRVKQFRGYTLALRFSEPARHYSIAGILHSIVKIPSLKNGQLDSENHEFGYHIHLALKQKKYTRTDILLTFNKNDGLDSNGYQPLYWERHAEKGHVCFDIVNLSPKKRRSIHSSCLQFLKLHPLGSFKMPSAKSYILQY
ncbi:hypothetical protein QNE71_004435 [Vibrio alginolyticus]|nr:hypothetical protein [Vibrio alginolyticus]